MMDMRSGKLVGDCPRCGTYNHMTEVPAWYQHGKVKQIGEQSFDMWEAMCSNCSLYYRTGTNPLPDMRTPTEEKKLDLTGCTFTPNSWSLVHGHDEDGYVVSITNKKFGSLQLDDDAFAIVNEMIVGILNFLKRYAKLGDPVDEETKK